MSDYSVNEALSELTKKFSPQVAEGFDADIQLKLTGDKGGNWYISIKEGTCQVLQGITATPTMTMESDATDLFEIFSGKLDPASAFMSGKLKISGDIMVALKLVSLFKKSA